VRVCVEVQVSARVPSSYEPLDRVLVDPRRPRSHVVLAAARASETEKGVAVVLAVDRGYAVLDVSLAPKSETSAHGAAE